MAAWTLSVAYATDEASSPKWVRLCRLTGAGEGNCSLMFSFGNSRPEMSARWRNRVRFAPVRPLKLAAFCTTSNKWMSTGSLLGSSSLPNPIYRGSGTPHGARLNSHEMTIQNGFKPTQSLLPMEGPTCDERKSGPRHAVAGLIQPPRPMATKLRTLQKSGGKRG